MNFEKMYLTKEPPLNRVCVCEDLDFYWDDRDLKKLKKLWQSDVEVNRIAEHFDRDPDEVILAIIHLAREDKIKRRNRGLLG
jgi:hypothetical protein